MIRNYPLVHQVKLLFRWSQEFFSMKITLRQLRQFHTLARDRKFGRAAAARLAALAQLMCEAAKLIPRLARAMVLR